LRDHPALATAVERAERVVPLFVLDDVLIASFGRPNRLAFLRDALVDLDQSLRRCGARLVLRRGDVVDETMRLAHETGSEAVFVSEDVSPYATGRRHRLTRACDEARIELSSHPGITVLPPGRLTPSDAEAYRVFTPYWRRWSEEPRRRPLPSPRRVRLPSRIRCGRLPALDALTKGSVSPRLPQGGETAAWQRAVSWLRSGLGTYHELRDDLAADATSRLSPYLHFGCMSPLELVERVACEAGSEPFLRQLCWRDFHHQLAAAGLQTLDRELRPRTSPPLSDRAGLEAWRTGRTGIPIVDAAMRQLRSEGWMHNRARLIAGSFLTRDLGIDWRLGAKHFFDLLVDGDFANNVGNWQWVAGTGADTRPNRRLNVLRQALRCDSTGAYARCHVEELVEIEGSAVHAPWRLGGARPRAYPLPIVDPSEPARRA
jgi:deoxyribodipyrimidine photo-lyase